MGWNKALVIIDQKFHNINLKWTCIFFSFSTSSKSVNKKRRGYASMVQNLACCVGKLE